MAIYGSRKTIKESWPATTGIEFSCGLVERSSTSSAGINSLVIELVVFPSAWIPLYNLIMYRLHIYVVKKQLSSFEIIKISWACHTSIYFRDLMQSESNTSQLNPNLHKVLIIDYFVLESFAITQTLRELYIKDLFT